MQPDKLWNALSPMERRGLTELAEGAEAHIPDSARTVLEQLELIDEEGAITDKGRAALYSGNNGPPPPPPGG